MTEYDITKRMLNVLREGKMRVQDEASMITEDTETKKNKLEDAVAITDDPRFGQRVLSQQIEQFRSAVDSGAEFSHENTDEVANNPLIWLPKDKNLIFSGVIPRMNNLKFQFLLKTNTGDGCFLWGDGFILNDQNMGTLSKLYGFYQNWVKSWTAEASDFEKLTPASPEN